MTPQSKAYASNRSKKRTVYGSKTSVSSSLKTAQNRAYKPFLKDFPDQLRVSFGSAIVLGLLEGKLDCAPTTAYFMTYRKRKCDANCSFCPQARESRGRDELLSRISWPVFSAIQVMMELEKAVKEGQIKRVCIQALNYPHVFTHVVALIKAVQQTVHVPISVSCQPLNRKNIKQLAVAGAERISIPLDASTEELFDKVKGFSAGGPYRWERQFHFLGEAVAIFGEGKVSTHLIVGLGESEREMVEIIQRCVDISVLPALFAFTPIPGTVLEKKAQPPVEKYRRIQIARYLILHGITRYENMHFDGREGRLTDFGVGKKILKERLQNGDPFLTSGCLDCNRPFYNEKPSGPIFNYPRKLSVVEVETILTSLKLAPQDGKRQNDPS